MLLVFLLHKQKFSVSFLKYKYEYLKTNIDNGSRERSTILEDLLVKKVL